MFACQPQETVTFSDTDATAVKAASADYGSAIVAGDTERLAALFDANIELMPPEMPSVKGATAAGKFMDEGPSMSGSISPEEVQGDGDMAYVRGSFNLTFQVNDSTQEREAGKYLEIWKRQEDGSWKVVKDMWSPNEDDDGSEEDM